MLSDFMKSLKHAAELSIWCLSVMGIELKKGGKRKRRRNGHNF